MSVTVKTENSLKERMFIYTLSSEAKCYIIPKYGFSQKQAAVIFRYGSCDINFSACGNKISHPLGTAHFLEHKMFQKKNVDFFTEFLKNGADSNAFTDANKTAYYFSCRENFYNNFESLLKMVTEEYFDDESVEREKGIIGQEIAMYDDDPNWAAYFNMLKKLYKKNPVRYGIAGTEESIRKICADTLSQAYNAFYTPRNMTIVVCGDVDCKKVFETAEKMVKERESDVVREEYKETDIIGNNFVSKKMGLSVPVFNIGFRHSPGENGVKQIYGYKMLLDIIAGESSKSYEKAFVRELVSQPLGLQYVWGGGVSLSVISGQSGDARKLGNGIIREINCLKKSGIDNETFKRIKKKHLGRFTRGFNSIDAICMAQTELCGLNSDLFDSYNVIKNMDKDYIETLLTSFNSNCAVLSVVE